MADYRDDARWKEYGFGRDMFPGGGAAPVASSEYMTAGMWEDYIRPGIEWLGDVIPGIGRSDTSSKETVDEGTKLLRDMMDADEESRKDMDRLLRETEEYDKTFKKISGEYDEYDKTERPGDITKFVKDAVSEAEVRAAWEDWADYGSPTDGSSDTIVTDPDTGVDILYDGATPILDMIGPGTSGTFGSKMSADTSVEPDWDAYAKGMEARYLSGELGVEPLGRGSDGYVWYGMPGTSTYTGSIPTLDERLDVPDVYTGDPDLPIEDVTFIDKLPIAKGGVSLAKLAADVIKGTAGKKAAKAKVDAAMGPLKAPIDPALPGLKSAAKTATDIAVATGAATTAHIPTAATTATVRRLLGDVGSARYKEVAKALKDTGHMLTPEQFAQQHLTKALGTPGIGASFEATIPRLGHELLRGARSGAEGIIDAFKRSIPLDATKAGWLTAGGATALGKSVLGEDSTPYTDPYPGMIDPTFEPSATVHYDDVLKHFETEAVPGHLPMDITDTPSYAEIMGESYKYDPVMPPPSAYSRPDMELDLATRALIDSDMDMARTTLGDPGYVDPYPGVDDFSGIIPSGIPSYMKYDAGGVLHDTRRFGEMPPGYDWRTGTFAGGSEGPYAGGSSASMSDDDRLAAALERMASIPAGFIGGPEKTMTYIDATGGPTARFGGVGDIGGGSGTITSPLTGRGGFYAPIGVPPISYTDPGLAPGMGGLGDLWT
jgi:hypothetical protein